MIGFIGLGQLGSRLVTILLEAGKEVQVFDLNQGAMDRSIDKGASPSESIVDLAGKSETVITCLPTPQASATVMTEALPQMKEKAMWIEMSTTSVTEIV